MSIKIKKSLKNYINSFSKIITYNEINSQKFIKTLNILKKFKKEK